MLIYERQIICFIRRIRQAHSASEHESVVMRIEIAIIKWICLECVIPFTLW